MTKEHLIEMERIADPEMLMAIKRFRVMFGLLLLAIVILVAAVAWQTVENTGQETRLAKIETAAYSCEIAPRGPQCQRYLRILVRARDVKATCEIFHRVGHPCPVGDVKTRLDARETQ